MQNPVLTERVKSVPSEKKYETEEILVLISFVLESLKYMDSDYKTPTAFAIDKKVLFLDGISRHPFIEKSIDELVVVKASLLNFMKDHFGSQYVCPMKISDKEKKGVHTLYEENTGEFILFTDTPETALISCYDLLKKISLKMIDNSDKYGVCSFYNSCPELNKMMFDLCLKKILTAKTFIKSLTYSI